MIAFAKACIGGTALANYVMKPEKGYELFRNNLSGETPTEILQEMKIIQDQNQRASKRTFSFVLSPEKNEAKNLSDETLIKISKKFLDGLKVDSEKQQFIAIVHTEKAHKHIHIIANRVKEDGTLISDHHIGKRAHWVAHRIAKENGLTSAKEKFIENLKNEKATSFIEKSVKNEIYRKHLYVISTNPRSIEKYISKMKTLDVNIRYSINNKNQIQGLSILDIASELEFKASEVHRKLSLKNLMELGILFTSNHLPLHPNIEKVQKSVSKQFADSNVELDNYKIQKTRLK